MNNGGVFQVAAMPLPGMLDPSIGIAASRAGALGMLNLEFIRSLVAARCALSDLVRYSRGQTGVKFCGRSRELLETLASELPDSVRIVLLTASSPSNLATHVQTLHENGRTVWLEVSSHREAADGLSCGVDGLVAKGNEAGGWVSDETTFVLLQRLLSETSLPVWAYGGIGLHTAAACAMAGATGVILDCQLALTRESRLPEKVKEAIAAMDGSETVCIAGNGGELFRAYSRPRLPGLTQLQEAARKFANQPPTPEAQQNWRETAIASVAWNSVEDDVWPLGQDACFAAGLAGKYQTVGGVIKAIREAVSSHIRSATRHRPLEIDAGLAESHKTRYPIVQGPMTRVSDTAEFAYRVAKEGGLPILALALMRGSEVDRLLHKTQEALGDMSWGVGILGFVPLELRQEQLDVILQYRPPFAVIAGGRPDQAVQLEKHGIQTYLHVPSPGLLRLFVQDGARRFVFEGRECGGHVGPRSSFVLWNSMIDVLISSLPPTDAANCHVLFAGGVHDARSAAMIATLAAPLVEIGVRIGVLLGTAYLFTEEAVSSGAILPGFQRKALECDQTVLVESGPGYAIRCVPNDFTLDFEAIKQRLLAEGKPAEQVRMELEELNVGRLRIAAKGVQRNPHYQRDAAADKFVSVDELEQFRSGMYMIGQVAALCQRTTTIAALHEEISTGSTRFLELAGPKAFAEQMAEAARPARIAIVGMSCMLPKARDLSQYWDNILNNVYAITEIPKDRWDWELYFDTDRMAPDKIYSKWGGFLDDEDFDPLEYGMPPNSLPSIDTMQLLALKAAKRALQDAGYADRPFDRSRTAVILGASGGSGELGTAYNLRSSLPLVLGPAAAQVIDQTRGILPEWTEDSFAGLLPNVAAGRIANRLDLGGANYAVDAACASSLTAVHLAMKELESKNAEMVIAGGVDTVQTPFGYLCFSKTQALSPTGQPRTFDATADGIAISEGCAFLVMKRLDDAERDGDRIYAVLQSTGASSDGKAKGLTAPRREGQMLALERAYATAGFSPTTVTLFEAHGTGTVVGDQTEANSLATFLEQHGAQPAAHAVGSVKSMIGHTKATAGIAGLVKVALSLYHKILPPTLGVSVPNPKAGFGQGPLYINSEVRPWIHSSKHPRRAGVSAFGFGGTNFHAVLEEYNGGFIAQPGVSAKWPSELLLWCGSSPRELGMMLESLHLQLLAGARPELHDLAYTLARQYEWGLSDSTCTIGIVASSADELIAKLETASAAISQARSICDERNGVFYTATPLVREGSVAFLFPGQGSQYVNMLRDLTIHFDQARQAFEFADHILAGKFPRPLSEKIFPPPAFSPEQVRLQQEALTATDVAQPALGTAEIAMFRTLGEAGVRASMYAGHSFGEFVALHAADVFDAAKLVMIAEARGRCMVEAAKQEIGTMVAVSAGPEQVAGVIASRNDVWLSNLNAPQQTVISGTRVGIEWAVEHLKKSGVQTRAIPVAGAFHSPLVASAQQELRAFLAQCSFAPPNAPVFSNVTAAPYPEDSQGISDLLVQHLASPVRFADQIQAMYAAGARIFVEVGPRNVLTGLVRQNLMDRNYLAVATDQPSRSGITQLQIALAQLASNGVPVHPTSLFRQRSSRPLDLNKLADETKSKPKSSTTWLVNGSRARPHGQPAPVIQRAVLAPETPRAAISLTGNASRAEDVMFQFQNLMSKFLDTQRHVMSMFLRGDAGSTTLTAAPNSGLTEAAPQFTARPTTRSIDTTQHPSSPARPEVLRSGPPPTSGETKISAEGATATATAQVSVKQDLTNRLLEIVSERTGYPPNLLSLDADVEAELGIDSIKRVEIIGVLQRVLLSDQQLGAEGIEQLAAVKTLRGIVDWFGNALDALTGVKRQAISGPSAESAELRNTLPSKEELAQQLVQIVSERTGYPPEMLQLDADLEAELGIDSIKRVEILGALQRVFLATQQGFGEDAMQQLTSIKTLRGIVDWIHQALHEMIADAKSSDVPLVEPPSASSIQLLPELPRLRFIPLEAPLADGAKLRLDPAKLVLVTDDGRGVASAVADELRAQGGTVVVVRPGDFLRRTESEFYEANLGDPQGIEALLDQIQKEHGPLQGIVHLVPLAKGSESSPDIGTWRARLRQETKSLFNLLRVAAATLKQSGGAPSFLLAATAMGGTGGLNIGAQRFFPGHGAVAGMVKTAALEWPSIRCKAVDTDLNDPVEEIAACLVREIASDDPQIAVGWAAGRRRVFSLVPVEFEPERQSQLKLDSDSVVLVTGGARGITAEVAIHLAQSYRPKLVIAARSPWPAGDEPADTVNLATAREIKPALIQKLRAAGEEFTIAKIESACDRILRDREMRDNLARIRRAGADVQYVSVDVCDEQAMTALVEKILGDYGRLDGVIHGAGIIEDKRIADKSPDSFDRVFDTKVDSAFILGQVLPTDSLKFLVLFSSAAAAYGNIGQSDYAAANEVLNKLAIDWDARWPGRVVSIGWGPWASVGMVDATLQKSFEQRGIQLIGRDAGCQALDREIQFGGRGEAAVIVGAWGSQNRVPPAHVVTPSRVNQPTEFPLLLGGQRHNRGGTIEIVRTFDPAHDVFLLDHRLDGVPVFPLAMAVELMAEAAQSEWRDLYLHRIRDLQLLKGITFEDGAKSVRVVLRAHTDAPLDQSGASVVVEISDPERPARRYYRSTAELVHRLPQPPTFAPLPTESLGPFPKSVAESYQDWLFQGPIFQGISKFEGISERGMAALLRPSEPEQYFTDVNGELANSKWLIDPTVFDSALQLMILWTRFHSDMSLLPSRFAQYRRFASLSSKNVRCHVDIKAVSGSPTVIAAVYFTDGENRILGILEEMESCASRELNRLAAKLDLAGGALG